MHRSLFRINVQAECIKPNNHFHIIPGTSILVKFVKFLRTPFPVDILILYRCWSDIALDIAMTLLIYCKWNTWRCQFAISTWHQDLEIGPIGLLMSSGHRRDNGRYPAEINPPGSYATSVSATIMPCFYCGNWKLKHQATFFQLLPPEDIMS